jgi:hypothetical protein
MAASVICDLSLIGTTNWEKYQVEGKKCINSYSRSGLYTYTKVTDICTIPPHNTHRNTWTCSFRTIVLSRTIFICQSIPVKYPESLTRFHVAHQLCLLLLIVMKLWVLMCMSVQIYLKWPPVIKITSKGGGLFGIH